MREQEASQKYRLGGHASCAAAAPSVATRCLAVLLQLVLAAMLRVPKASPCRPARTHLQSAGHHALPKGRVADLVKSPLVVPLQSVLAAHRHARARRGAEHLWGGRREQAEG